MKLSDHPFIQNISDTIREAIVSEIELITFEDGDVIYLENCESEALYLILEGNVAFTKEKFDGTFRKVGHAGAGGFFGEVGVFTGEQRALGAMAQGSAVHIGRVPATTVNKITADPESLRKILSNIIQHHKDTIGHYIDEVMRTEKLTLVGTMVSSILHDFKNPFSIISLGSHLIGQRHADDPKTAQICKNVELQVRRMVNMANNLTAFSRGDSEIEVAHISLEELFDTFRELNAPFFKDKAVNLEMQSNAISLQGDATKLLRLLQNLVTNSIEALRQSDRDGYVKVETSESGDYVTLTLSDNGPGIPKAIQSTLFEPFVTYGKNEGTGLGTATVKSIVDAHNGDIVFQSSPQGTTFTIRLPKDPRAKPKTSLLIAPARS